ncbi:MAG: hypothetical protein ACREEM_47915, partial [Blastocatellia bacterium]
ARARDVEDGCVIRMPKAYPVYDGEYQGALQVIRKWLEGLPNLHLIGRNGQHRYNNQDHSMLTGVYAARNIAGADYDVWSVNTEMEYHEEVRGEKAENATAGDRLTPARVSVNVPASIDAASDALPDRLIEAAFAKLDPLALGIAIGAVIGIGLFLAAAILLLKSGESVRPNLFLLSNYFPGFSPSWPGAFVGLAEAGSFGFVLGFIVAWLRNWSLEAYAAMLKRRVEAESERDLLDKF